MRTVIIDDEEDAIENLRSILRLFGHDIQVVGVAQSVAAGVAEIREKNPELVFLDIEMPNGNGFKVLEQTMDVRFQTIFITAHYQFAIKALRMNAVDYLLKPIDPDELEAAIGRAKEKTKAQSFADHKELLKSQQAGKFEKLGIPTTKGVRFVPLDDIIRFQAANNYTEVFIRNEKQLLVSKTLKTFEKTLAGGNFVRVHQSHLINVNLIREFNRAEGSHVILENGDRIAVSKDNRAALNKALQEKFRQLL